MEVEGYLVRKVKLGRGTPDVKNKIEIKAQRSILERCIKASGQRRDDTKAL